MAVGGNSLYIKRDQEAVGPIPYSGSLNAISTGTFIGMDTDGNAVVASMFSGSGQYMAMGFALLGSDHGTFTTNQTTRFDAVDNPFGYGKFSSGSYTIGQPIYLASGQTINFSATAPVLAGQLYQTLGWVVPDRAGNGTWFRIHIGTPMRVTSGGILRVFNGPGQA